MSTNGAASFIEADCPECGGPAFAPQDEPDRLICPRCEHARIEEAFEDGYAAAREDEPEIEEFPADEAAEVWEPAGVRLDRRRYEGRHVDLAPLLAAPPRPVPWRVQGLVADATLTVLAGESGAGKSWLALAVCTAVAAGRPVAGMPCAAGRALYVDAEMGADMMTERVRATGATSVGFDYIDGMGLDLSMPADLAWLRSKVLEVRANFVVIDSLRRMAPGASENDSDAMAPIVAALATLARDTRAAVLLIHHKGDSDKFWRGSTAIRDQADALLALTRDGEDDELRRLRCRGGGKMRYAEEPGDVWLAISPLDGGVTEASAPVRKRRLDGDGLKAAIVGALPEGTKRDVALRIGCTPDERSFREAWDEMATAGQIRRSGSPKRWTAVTTPPNTTEEVELR